MGKTKSIIFGEKKIMKQQVNKEIINCIKQLNRFDVERKRQIKKERKAKICKIIYFIIKNA